MIDGSHRLAVYTPLKPFVDVLPWYTVKLLAIVTPVLFLKPGNSSKKWLHLGTRDLTLREWPTLQTRLVPYTGGHVCLHLHVVRVEDAGVLRWQ